ARAARFWARHVVGTPELEVAPAPAGKVQYDVAVSDRALPAVPGLPGPSCLRVPQWIGQRVALAPRWEDTLQSLARGLRKELRRLLRKHAFSAGTTSSPDAKVRFYEELYEPYLSRRYGESANVRGLERFLAETAGA